VYCAKYLVKEKRKNKGRKGKDGEIE